MNKKNNIWIIIICICMAALAGGAVWINRQTRKFDEAGAGCLETADKLERSYENMLEDQTAGGDDSAGGNTAKEENSPVTEKVTEKTDESGVDVSTAKVIFVGDSRTVGMGWAEKDVGDPCIYIGQSGEGLRWFQEEGYDEMAAAIRENPELPVVFNLGVNDVPDEYAIGHYLDEYAAVEDAFPDTVFYFMSVNPVDEDLEEAVTDDMITSFNAQIKAAFPDAYIDTYSIMKEEGFETMDGIHYTEEQYRLIHDYVILRIFGETEQKGQDSL